MADDHEGKIRNSGLEAIVGGWVISSTVGCHYPDPAIFGEIAQKLQCSLDGCMVGDSIEHYIAGGMAVSVRTA